ncbi:hypothetical protein KIM372_06750 [Bombiscardovia nodaiensis]|uniref:Uncharacterized protein n=1 Tax=Bombiscardovia nodaiensis TaxID=2932181 RepID=A0ABM8B7X1_9BIFI|nr:hypothetical protein KIM372_06750 [Bombiscardovia nodaiensis]
MDQVADQLKPVSANHSAALTDDKAPVELLGMHAIDKLIADQAGPYRQILKEHGIQGLMEELD